MFIIDLTLNFPDISLYEYINIYVIFYLLKKLKQQNLDDSNIEEIIDKFQKKIYQLPKFPKKEELSTIKNLSDYSKFIKFLLKKVMMIKMGQKIKKLIDDFNNIEKLPLSTIKNYTR